MLYTERTERAALGCKKNAPSTLEKEAGMETTNLYRNMVSRPNPKVLNKSTSFQPCGENWGAGRLY